MSRYTHGHHESVLRSHRARTAKNSAAYLIQHLDADMHLLDIGAGPGTITADLAELTGRVTATEISDEILSITRREIANRGLTNVAFEVQDIHRLTFPDEFFDVVHAHQVLQHVSDPVRALREARRVTKKGGIVAVRDADFSGYAWYPLEPGLDDWLSLYRGAAIANGGDPDAGRKLLSWAQQAGFSDIEASSSTWCYATPETRAFWAETWAERMTKSAVARQIVDSGDASAEELADIAASWRNWANAPDGWFSVLHGELICRV